MEQVGRNKCGADSYLQNQKCSTVQLQINYRANREYILPAQSTLKIVSVVVMSFLVDRCKLSVRILAETKLVLLNRF